MSQNEDENTSDVYQRNELTLYDNSDDDDIIDSLFDSLSDRTSDSGYTSISIKSEMSNNRPRFNDTIHNNSNNNNNNNKKEKEIEIKKEFETQSEAKTEAMIDDIDIDFAANDENDEMMENSGKKTTKMAEWLRMFGVFGSGSTKTRSKNMSSDNSNDNTTSTLTSKFLYHFQVLENGR